MKNIKCILLVFVIFGIVLFNFKNINRLYLKCDMEKDLLNMFRDIDYNTKYFADSEDLFIYWMTDTKHRYDVTNSIEDYLYKIDRCYRIKKYQEDINEDYKNKKAYDELFNFKRKKRDFKKYNYLFENNLNPMYYEFVIKKITKEQIDNYDQIELRRELIEDLKTKFVYEDDRWVIESNERIEIDLPYNVIIGLTPDGKITNNNAKKYTSIKIKSPLTNILSEGKEDNIKLPFELTYIDEDNKKNVKELYIDVNRQKDENSGKYKYSYKLDLVKISNLFSIPSVRRYFTFGHKDYNEYIKTQQEPEPDPSTIEVRTEFRDVEMFEKYKQYAEIYVIEYADGSSRAFFRKHINYMVNEKRKVGKFMRRELPYKNKTIEEVMELYLNDKEQYSIDEELLKNCIELVKYDSYEM